MPSWFCGIAPRRRAHNLRQVRDTGRHRSSHRSNAALLLCVGWKIGAGVVVAVRVFQRVFGLVGTFARRRANGDEADEHQNVKNACHHPTPSYGVRARVLRRGAAWKSAERSILSSRNGRGVPGPGDEDRHPFIDDPPGARRGKAVCDGRAAHPPKFRNLFPTRCGVHRIETPAAITRQRP